MDFISFYKAIYSKEEKRKIRKQVVDACQIQQSTFYAWMLKGKIPYLAQLKIAEVLEKTHAELFPE